jgi:uncharacterized membrane protein YhaH (DUF805 family)
MKLLTLYLHTWKNTFNYKGRASRSEFFYFYGINTLLTLCSFAMNRYFPNTSLTVLLTPLLGIYSLLTILPTITVAIRRTHDSGESGWWSIAPIASFYFLFVAGDEGDNTFGPPPQI